MRISRRMLRRTATITHVGVGEGVTEYGNAEPVTTTSTARCDLQLRRVDESNDRGEIPLGTYQLFLPPGTTLAAADTVTVDGLVYQVVGEPWTEPGSHVRAGLERA